MTTHWTGRRFWPLCGVLAVAALWAVSAAANYQAGTALSSEHPIIFGAAAIAVDVLKACLLFALSAALTNKRYIVLGLAVLLLALTTTWSLRAAGTLAYQTLITPTLTATHAAEIKADVRQLSDLQKRRAEFLTAQKITPAGKGKSVMRLANEGQAAVRAELAETLSGLKATISTLAEAPPTAGDPLAEALGVAPQITALAAALFFAVLLEITATAGFWVIIEAGRERTQSRALVVLAPPQPIVSEAPQPLLVETPIVEEPPVHVAAAPVTDLPQPPDPPKKTASRRAMQLTSDDLVTRAVAQHFEPARKDERILLASMITTINAALPIERRIASTAMTVRHVIPAIDNAGWQRCKIGGRVYVLGCRPRLVA